MKKYIAKNIDIALNEISEAENVNIDDIEFSVVEQSGFSIFSKVEIEYYTENDIENSIRDYINNVLIAMEFVVKEIEIKKEEGDYFVSISTDNNALIIGINGKNLYSLETLLRQVMANIYHRRFYITLDVNNYFKEKEEKLKRFAYKIAAEVGKTKIDAKLDPMPNYDRKVIHKVLKEVHYVETKSYGEGKNRYLIIHYDRENDLKHNENKNK